PGHWATNAIKNMVNKYQIMKGYPDNQFKGNNTLTRYELAAVLKKFVDYVDRYLIPIPKYIPTVAPTAVPTPIPTPIPTPLPTPVPTAVPTPDARTPLHSFDGKIGFEMKAASTGATTNNEVDTLLGPTAQINYWFPKFNDIRLGVGIDGSLLNYGKLLGQYHTVNSLRRNSFGAEVDWRILGVDYADDTSLFVALGYELIQWGGSSYNYSNNGPFAKAVFEVPIGQYFSIIAEEKFNYMISKTDNFNEQLVWKNDLFVGVNIMALSQFSFQIGYKDTRFSLGKPTIFGDIGGVANLRFRY
ncbi:S-layer homology domain-containing protein, partial [bacterium]